MLPDKVGAPGFFAETGGTLEFISDSPRLTLTFVSQNGAQGTLQCLGANDATPNPSGDKEHHVTCKIPRTMSPGTYTFNVTEIRDPSKEGQPPPLPPITLTLYIKRCQPPCRF